MAIRHAAPRSLARSNNNRPTLPREGAPVLQRATSALLGCATAIALGLASPLAPSASAAPVSLEARRAEQEAAFREQLERMQYSLAQQDNARRAELLGRRQVLESQVTQVEDAIGRKLVEEAANEQAAAKKGEDLRAVRIAEEEEQIRAQEAALRVAAAKAQAALAQADVVERAREVAEQQQVAKAGDSVMDLLGLKPSDFGGK